MVLDGYDITEWVLQVSHAPAIKSDWGQIPAIPGMSVTVRSNDFAFHPLHPASVLFGRDLTLMKLEVFENDFRVWAGYLTDAQLESQSRQVTLSGDSYLQRWLNMPARIDTTETSPAQAAENLLALYGIPTDSASFGQAKNLLDDIPSLVRVNPAVIDWGGTLGDILQLLASACVGRYFVAPDGSIGMDAYALDMAPIITATFTDRDLLQWPQVSNESIADVEGYAVTFLYGVVADGENRQAFDFGAQATVTMSDTGSAVYCGETWQLLSERDYLRIEFHLDRGYGAALPLGSWVRITSDRAGLDAPVEIIGLDSSDARWVRITGRIDKGIT